jgi:hypothetical protein
MAHISNVNLLDKARRHYRGERAKDSTLPALVPGGGEVKANGKLRIKLPRIDGLAVTYVAHPVTEWRFSPEPGLEYCSNGKAAEPSPADRAKQALSTLLDLLADAERHVHSAEPDSANITVNN